MAHFLILTGIMCAPLQFLPPSLALLPGASWFESLRRSNGTLFDVLVEGHAAQEHTPMLPVNSGMSYTTQTALPPQLLRPLTADTGTRPFMPQRKGQESSSNRRSQTRQKQAVPSRPGQRLHAVA